VPNWNGESLVKVCLGSLLYQSRGGAEVIFVDNGSTDRSVSYVKNLFPSVKVIELSENRGFTGSNTAGLQIASGDFIALINNDAYAERQWLENLLEPMFDDPRIGICASKILLNGTERVDSIGVGLTTAGVGFNRETGKIGRLFNHPEFFFGACGAAVLYRRRMLEEIGFLDDDFFLYDEDTDLSFRAQLAGWKCVYVPSAVVYHKGNATAGRLSDTHVYYHTRNLEFVWLKNTPAGLMLRFAHHKLIQEIGAFCYLCLRHGKWQAFFRAKRDAIRMSPSMWRKRKWIQSKRRVSNRYIGSLLTSMFSREMVRQKIIQFIRG